MGASSSEPLPKECLDRQHSLYLRHIWEEYWEEGLRPGTQEQHQHIVVYGIPSPPFLSGGGCIVFSSFVEVPLGCLYVETSMLRRV